MLKSFQKRVSARKTKLIKGLCLSITILFISLCTTPFQIYADTVVPVSYNSSSTQSQWSTHLHVTNYCESPLQGSTPCKLTFTLDDNYYGMIAFDGYAGSSLALNYVTVFVAGGIGEYNYRTFSNANPMYINSVNIMGVGLTVPDSNIDLSLIEQLLTSINNHEQTIENTELLSNNYLKIIQNRYDVAIESFPIVLQCLNNLELVSIQDVTLSGYPIFKIENGDTVAQFVSRQNNANDSYRELYLVGWWSTGWSLSGFNNRMSFTDGSISSLGRIQTSYINGSAWQLCRMTINGFGSTLVSPNTMTYTGTDPIYFVPIYLNYSNIYSYGTDFAQRYALPNNPELQYLEKMAQGTTESNSAAAGLDSETSSFESVASGLYTSENSFNQNMNSSLQSIDTSFNPSTSFGSKFLYSADWVRSQFNTITSNTPFGSVLSFSMLLGLSLLIIGKVFK